MKTLYIDLDGVVADFDLEIRNRIPGFYSMSEEEREGMVDKMCEEDTSIFHNLQPMEGAIEAVKHLFRHFEVYFLSTPMWTVPESFTGKRLWIVEHFGMLATKRLILTHRKDLNIGDFLVDDRLHNGADKFTGERIHFGTPEFPNWQITHAYLMTKI